METNRIYNESCLDTLAKMPDAFLDCLVTSPPYYGLRSYGTEPQVWGNHNGCDHVWGADLPYAKLDARTPEQKSSQGATVGNNRNSINFAVGNSGNFCSGCNAWRGELGLEPTFQLYISHLIDIFREVKRVLKPTGTVWVNLGDSYSGSGKGIGSDHGKSVFTDLDIPKAIDKSIAAKSLMNIPARFAIAMTDELQFIERNEIIWHKPACMPSSAKDRFTVDFEKIFFFTKEARYSFSQLTEAVSLASIERLSQVNLSNQVGSIGNGGAKTNGNMKAVGSIEGRNMRTVWTVNFEPSGDEHYAAYPTKLVERMIGAGCPENGIVYDPFGGTATTAVTAHRLGRQWICSELQPKYVELANRRLEPLLAQPSLI